MAIEVKVKIDGLDRLRKAIQANPALGRDIAAAWSTIYRAFVRQRFVAQSRGGGEWPPLAASTVARRRKGRGNGSPAILRDTGALLAALQPALGNEGLLQATPRPLGFTATLGGGRSYKNGATLVEVATYHHEGAGRLPARTILVVPKAQTIRTMSAKAKQIMVRFMNGR